MRAKPMSSIVCRPPGWMPVRGTHTDQRHMRGYAMSMTEATCTGRAGRLLVMVVTALMLASVLALATPAAAVAGPPRADHMREIYPERTSSGQIDGWNRKRLAWNKTFWVNQSSSSRATYWMGDLQGTFTLSYESPKGKSYNGGIKFKIYEKRVDESRYHLIRTLTDSRQNTKYTWPTWSKAKIEIDGSVKIVAQPTSRKKIALRRVSLNHVGVLPEHWEDVQIVCITKGLEIDKAVRDFLRRYSLKSPLLGDSISIEDRIEAAKEGQDAHATLKGTVQELLVAAAVRILEEVHASQATYRAKRLEEQCKNRGGGWHFTGLGWTRYKGWGHAARLLAETMHLFDRQQPHLKCYSIGFRGDLNTGCLISGRRPSRQ